MSEMKALPAWPTVYDTHAGREVNGVEYDFDDEAAAFAIVGANYAAALARLRVAVEAIVKMRDCETLNEELHIAYEALSSIGDLPAGEEG